MFVLEDLNDIAYSTTQRLASIPEHCVIKSASEEKQIPYFLQSKNGLETFALGNCVIEVMHFFWLPNNEQAVFDESKKALYVDADLEDKRNNVLTHMRVDSFRWSRGAAMPKSPRASETAPSQHSIVLRDDPIVDNDLEGWGGVVGRRRQ